MKETGVIFALIRDGKILMQQRDERCKLFPLAWCIPGGVKEEYDQTYEDTLVREVKEEFDLDISPTDCGCFMEHNDGADKVYVCKVSSTQVPKLQEGLAMKWMTISEIEKIELGFHQQGIVPELKKVLSLDNY